VNLRAIRLRGFKSFPEPVEVRLEPGVAVVVGPNGSGKSNVADAIVWAAGSMAPSELRAEKPDDVIFAGGGGRPGEDFCEVELLFDNPDGEGPLPYTELSVARRLHRGGEGQYLLNRTAVRRIDLVELLADLGLGGGMHSIIGQGRVEEILGSKPEERRELLEEAAGLGRFKKRKHRAELKLARVAIQVERARDVEAEVKKRLRPLALQATAAERAEKLRGEIASLRARVAELDLAELQQRLEDGEGRRTAAVLARRHADEKLDSLLEERRRAEEELADAAGRREQATATLYRLRSARERLEFRRESAQAMLDNLRTELARPRRVLDARVRAERETLREQARVAGERLQTLERALAEREGLPPAARALAEEGERLALSLLDVEPGTERAVAAALGHRAAAIVADDARAALALAERARAAGLGSVVVLTREPASVVRELPVVPKEQLLQSDVPRASGTTRAAASSGSPARRQRLCGWSWRREGARSPRRPTSSRFALRRRSRRTHTARRAIRSRSRAHAWPLALSKTSRESPTTASRRRCGRVPTPARRARARSPRSCGGSVLSRSMGAARRQKRPSG